MTNAAPAFPIAGMIGGVPVVTIPAAEYAALRGCANFAEWEARQWAFKAASRSPIERDPELAGFIASRLGLAPVRIIHAECVARFGPERTPSRSSISRYWSRRRDYPPT